MHPPPPPTFLHSFLARPWPRRLLRVARWGLVGLYFAVAFLVLALRYLVLPHIEDYRGDIEQALSGAFARPVAIRAIEARWQGLNPNLTIRGLEIRDREGRPALGFDQVEADLAWSSLWHFGLRLARLEVVAPTLDVRRDAAGRYFVAGLEVDPNSQDSGFSDWLLAQDRIVIRGATLNWHDELRAAPTLTLRQLNFDLQSSGSRHRFGLTAEPPAALATRLDLRADFKGRDLDALESWKGEAYLELDYADLAGWRAWVDYPVELPKGSGGLRLWAGFQEAALTGLTADVRLAGLQLRLAPDLPMLDVVRLEGRLAGRRQGAGFEAKARRLALATRDGVVVAPTDFEVRWQPADGAGAGRGEATATGLDLSALSALAGHLPLDPALRQRLAGLAPRGHLHELRLTWTGDAEGLKRYGVHARFEDLGLAAQGAVPGFSGLDGRIDGDEQGGSLELASKDATVELPSVFAEPKVFLATLDARAAWKMAGGQADVTLERVSFQNTDAAGEASGHYRGDGQGPGEIDLSARLTRATGGAVWRYMPLVVNRETRDWLHSAIVGGAATASLRLKGDLRHFPFRDGSGIFLVKGPFEGAALRYAADWPQIDNVSGDLEFSGARMTIRGHKAKLFGVALADVKAEILDLEQPEEIITITGAARGPTSDFLRYIEASPVGERIDHFTEDMAAVGNGELNLKLVMPLRHIVDTQVEGRYRFAGNTLTVDADMPPLAEVNGELRFTADKLEARGVRASLFGAPMTVDVATGDGGVSVKAAGTMTVRGLRQQFGHPVFEHLSGETPWKGTVRVRKKAAEVRIESSLAGISSSLPEPFNKTAGETLPLVFERKPPPDSPRRGAKPPAGVRDQLAASLGEVLRLQLVRRHEDGKARVERGLVAVGRIQAPLPDQGVLLAIQGGRVDADFWRRLGNGRNGNGNGDAALPLNRVDLRADELLALGRAFTNVRLRGEQEADGWRADLKSAEASGHLQWNSAGPGRLLGRFSVLSLAAEAGGKSATTPESPEQLPAIDLTADRFLWHGKELGELRLRADNKEGVWNGKLDLTNDDLSLDGNVRWRASAAAPDTQADFRLSVKSIEKMLGRVGYADAVRRGTASLEGRLSWSGSPVAVDYPTLSGNLKLDAGGGQFNKLEPGVGRLLGILSLQSLPRRITLDFRDVFSEGFAFDSIGGQFVLRRGMMETDELLIKGPAARVLMSGSVNLAQETQDLKVRVQPAIGETVATGMMLANPATGAVVWLADKLFKDPLGRAFAYDYRVTGTWGDPKVDKVSAPPVQGVPVPDAAAK